MRRCALLATLLLCCTASFAFALPDEFSSTRVVQEKGFGEVPQPAIMVGGDTFATATVIPALPYADGGSTCAFANDYTPPCALSTTPDVVYRFTPATDMCVNISLCGSSFDTVIMLYNGAVLAICQDDSPACGLQSDLRNVALVGGGTYYIVIDGYNTACGTYQLSVAQCPPPPVCDPCPPGAVAEGEPGCSDGYIDTYNGGCNSVPPVYTSLPCSPSQSVCGTYGTFNANGTRDTDWYRITVTAPTVLTVSVNGGGLTGSALAIIDNLCPPTILCGQFTPSAACATSTCVAAVGPGTYAIFTASFFDNTPCRTPYVLTVSGPNCPTPIQSASWGMLKTLYR